MQSFIVVISLLFPINCRIPEEMIKKTTMTSVSRIFRHFYFLATIFQLLLTLSVHATYDIDDAILYRVSFNEFGAKTGLSDVDQKGQDEIKLHGYSSKVKEPEPGTDVPSTWIPNHSDNLKLKNPHASESEEEEFDTIPMLTRHGEKYVCTIPRTDGKDKEKDSKNSYEGQTALALLEPLFVSQSCAYRLEHYWTYELCHGRFLRQYHEERDGKTIKVIDSCKKLLVKKISKFMKVHFILKIIFVFNHDSLMSTFLENMIKKPTKKTLKPPKNKSNLERLRSLRKNESSQ